VRGHQLETGRDLIVGQKTPELVEAAAPLVAELAGDEKLRGSALTALVSALAARNRLLASLGLGGLGWRLAHDPMFQAQLREFADSTPELLTRAQRLRARQRRRQRLLVAGGGLALAGGAAAAAAAAALSRKRGLVEQSIELDVPVAAAYQQWTQFEQFPRFMQGVEQVRQLDERHLHWVASVAGRRREWEAVISEQRPEERIAWQASSGKANNGDVSFQRLSDNRSQIRMQMQLEPEGPRERLASLLDADQRRSKGDLQRFKELIENRDQTNEHRRDETYDGTVTTQ
jgi:uncharacterized membrane protein